MPAAGRLIGVPAPDLAIVLYLISFRIYQAVNFQRQTVAR